MTPKTKYFKVTAKCGHVGRGQYIPINFAVKAYTASEASQKAREFPRVKKHLWDAIIGCEEVSKKEYKEILKINRKDPYLKCKCAKDHAFIENEEKRIVRNTKHCRRHKVEPVKNMKYRKALYELGGRRNSMHLCYGED